MYIYIYIHTSSDNNLLYPPVHAARCARPCRAWARTHGVIGEK